MRLQQKLVERFYRATPLIALFPILFLCIWRDAAAGEYHWGSKAICSDCHVAHASKGQEIWTPTEKLLKNSAGQVALCMSCHDGSDIQAPDIAASGTAVSPSNIVTTAYTSEYGSSAGFFQSDYLTAANPSAHDMQPSVSISAPLSTNYTKAGGLVCSDCHDPHGTANYRNLISDPNPSNPGSHSILLNVNVNETIPVDADTPNPAEAYDAGNVSFYVQNNIGSWCTDCHNSLSQNILGVSPAHFKGHPSNVEIGALDSYTDLQNWLSGFQSISTGFGTEVGDGLEGIPRLRFGSSSGGSMPASGDTAFCLSCHKAHGSKYKYAKVWPYHESGADMLSGCQQCHFK